MSWNKYEMLVLQWAEARRIIPNATPVSQLLKAVSEMGELCDAEGKQDRAAIIDAVGDVLVCLINYCALHDMDMTDCLASAYEQIKNRKGTLMPDGTFVKASK
jgi:NTP pyrophosphatase (non-canonical NTP hydrolase)